MRICHEVMRTTRLCATSTSASNLPTCAKRKLSSMRSEAQTWMGIFLARTVSTKCSGMARFFGACTMTCVVQCRSQPTVLFSASTSVIFTSEACKSRAKAEDGAHAGARRGRGSFVGTRAGGGPCRRRPASGVLVTGPAMRGVVAGRWQAQARTTTKCARLDVRFIGLVHTRQGFLFNITRDGERFPFNISRGEQRAITISLWFFCSLKTVLRLMDSTFSLGGGVFLCSCARRGAQWKGGVSWRSRAGERRRHRRRRSAGERGGGAPPRR